MILNLQPRLRLLQCQHQPQPLYDWKVFHSRHGTQHNPERIQNLFPIFFIALFLALLFSIFILFLSFLLLNLLQESAWHHTCGSIYLDVNLFVSLDCILSFVYSNSIIYVQLPIAACFLTFVLLSCWAMLNYECDYDEKLDYSLRLDLKSDNLLIIIFYQFFLIFFYFILGE